MSEAPERIWINKFYGRHPEDWDFTDGKHLTKAQLRKKIEYVPAARIEELEAKLAKAVEALQAFKDFDDLPLESKRPDVFEIKVRKTILIVLAELKGEKE